MNVITIKLLEENGKVVITSDPPMRQLMMLSVEDVTTLAINEIYALAALRGIGELQNKLADLNNMSKG